METIFYVKKGKRYIPHSTYSSEFCDSFPKGTHLVQSYPGGQSRRFNIDPAYAPMIAAGRVAEDAICDAILKASEIKPQRTPITIGQKKAWEKLAKEFGDELCPLSYGSARDHAEAGVKAMVAEASKLMENPAVKKAYEHFMLVCKLSQTQSDIKV
jgi:hypothetical protein